MYYYTLHFQTMKQILRGFAACLMSYTLQVTDQYLNTGRLAPESILSTTAVIKT